MKRLQEICPADRSRDMSCTCIWGLCLIQQSSGSRTEPGKAKRTLPECSAGHVALLRRTGKDRGNHAETIWKILYRTIKSY